MRLASHLSTRQPPPCQPSSSLELPFCEVKQTPKGIRPDKNIPGSLRAGRLHQAPGALLHGLLAGEEPPEIGVGTWTPPLVRKARGGFGVTTK